MSLNLENLPRTLELVADFKEAVPQGAALLPQATASQGVALQGSVPQGVALRYIDQRLLPGELVFESATTWQQVVDAVKTLAVRGAPAIGVAGAAAVALWAAEKCAQLTSSTPGAISLSATCDASYQDELEEVARQIASARPTAVNLSWGVNQALDCAREAIALDGANPCSVAEALCTLTKQMEQDDEATNRAIGQNGAALLGEGTRILTHCNAGSLATVFYGTALGVVYAAAEQGKIERVYADETRPVGQGARLTVWELAQAGVPVTLICDDMAATVMSQGLVDAVIVGADRIAANGDVANKIGTLGVAILAHEFGIPFYVAAPTSTIDMSLATGDDIVIEQRAASEVLAQSIPGVDVLNPAFDVTPACYITRIITDTDVFKPTELPR